MTSTATLHAGLLKPISILRRCSTGYSPKHIANPQYQRRHEGAELRHYNRRFFRKLPGFGDKRLHLHRHHRFLNR